ncbi:hypothetical protein J3R82DRAFT_6823 [Butyriboletus roseoflavus]|nr:hypothetical protein J3R82DRAFT_6823 [Butyriboletus roseoflavus]
MSHSRNAKASESSLVARNDAIQGRLSTREAKRVAKAADRQEKSDAFKEEVSLFSLSLKIVNQQTTNIRVTPSFVMAISKTLWNGTNEPLTYTSDLQSLFYWLIWRLHISSWACLSNYFDCVPHTLMIRMPRYSEAHDAAERALVADPTSVKARYRRGMARKHMKMWTAAGSDFRTMLALDPGNKVAEADLAFAEEKRHSPSHWEAEEEETKNYTDYEDPALEDDPQLGESLSESSDCEHTGNGIPCKFYNRTECKNRRACRFSHAPDKKSERDALGRNVCRYYLIGVCKFGERCSYLHSEEYLLQRGWWSTAEGIDNEKKRYNLIRMCNKAITDYNNVTKVSGTGQTSKKKQTKGKKKRDHHSRSGFEGSEPSFASARNQSNQLQTASNIGQSSQKMNTKSKKKPTVYSYPSWEGYDSDEGSGMFGFTSNEVDELLCQGVKPWDDDARVRSTRPVIQHVWLHFLFQGCLGCSS